MKKGIAILFFLVAAGLAVFWFLLPSIKEKSKIKQITTFEQCAAAGYPVMQSYPRQCILPSGRAFVETYLNEERLK